MIIKKHAFLNTAQTLLTTSYLAKASLIGSDSAMYYLLIDFYIKVLEYIALVTHYAFFLLHIVCLYLGTYLLTIFVSNR